MKKELTLNVSQKKAYTQIRNWLLKSDEKCFNLTSPPGFGKSFLINYIIDSLEDINICRKVFDLPEVYLHVAATTNKAANVLRESFRNSNNNSFLGLKITTVHALCKIPVNPSKSQNISKFRLPSNSFVIIDEASQITSEVLEKILEASSDDCKILFVGDPDQHLPVGEKTSPVFHNSDFSNVSLDIPQRQSKNSDLYQFCKSLKETIKTGKWSPIPLSEEIKVVSAEQSQEIFHDWFTNFTHKDYARAITFTNQKAQQYNQYVRSILGLPDFYQVGETVCVRNFTLSYTGYGNSISALTICQIESIEPMPASTFLIDLPPRDKGIDLSSDEFFEITFKGIKGKFMLPKDPVKYSKDLLKIRSNKRIKNAFCYSVEVLSNHVVDLRSNYAETSHSSQGSTYDKVFINLDDLSKLKTTKAIARCLYVAASRAKKQVILNGKINGDTPHEFKSKCNNLDNFILQG